jgi:hypothetical protein
MIDGYNCTQDANYKSTRNVLQMIRMKGGSPIVNRLTRMAATMLLIIKLAPVFGQATPAGPFR